MTLTAQAQPAEQAAQAEAGLAALREALNCAAHVVSCCLIWH